MPAAAKTQHSQINTLNIFKKLNKKIKNKNHFLFTFLLFWVVLGLC